MENQFKTQRAALVLLAASLLSACASAPPAAPFAPPLRPVQLGITQAGYGPAVRYVYCEVGTCPQPSAKTVVPVVVPVAAQASVFAPKRLLSLEIAFPFNSPRISEDDQQLLAETAALFAHGEIDIIARSDFVGPKGGQLKVLQARASALRAIVAKQAPGARISERREVAGPARVAAAEQAQQRKGSVRFTQPIDVHLKGTPK